MPQCPSCHARVGQLKAGRNHSGSQRYLCGACGKSYTPEPYRNGYPDELRKKVISMCLEGQTFRAIARKVGVNHQTVANWVNDYVVRNARAIYKRPQGMGARRSNSPHRV